MKRTIVAAVVGMAFAVLVFVLAGARTAYCAGADAEEERKPARGMFLVADGKMRDPRFAEAVILLLDINRNGAAGLIINRPSDVKLSRIFPQFKRLKRGNDKLYFGGPVETERLLMLLRSNRLKKSFVRVFDGVYATNSRAAQLAMLKRGVVKFRIYAGYAGWGVGQLEREISRGDWHVLPADADMVFSADASKIWHELIRKSTEIFVWATDEKRL